MTWPISSLQASGGGAPGAYHSRLPARSANWAGKKGDLGHLRSGCGPKGSCRPVPGERAAPECKAPGWPWPVLMGAKVQSPWVPLVFSPLPAPPRILKAWLSYLGNQAAGPSKDGHTVRAKPQPGPARVNHCSLPVPQSCGPSFVPTPHVGLQLPCCGDAGPALGLAPSPAYCLTHSLWLPGAELCPDSWSGTPAALAPPAKLWQRGRGLLRLP